MALNKGNTKFKAANKSEVNNTPHFKIDTDSGTP
jgi:hypothetical protein